MSYLKYRQFWGTWGTLRRVFLFDRFLKFDQITFALHIWLFQGICWFHPLFHCSYKWAKAQLSFLYLCSVRVAYLCSICCTPEVISCVKLSNWTLISSCFFQTAGNHMAFETELGRLTPRYDMTAYREKLTPVLLRSLQCLLYCCWVGILCGRALLHAGGDLQLQMQTSEADLEHSQHTGHLLPALPSSASTLHYRGITSPG